MSGRPAECKQKRKESICVTAGIKGTRLTLNDGRDRASAQVGEPSLSTGFFWGIEAAVTGGTTDSQWWAGESAEGPRLSDEAVDWIETVANDEEPTAS